MTKYLDLNKLEYVDSIVEIDDDIADTILELNKKGYKTLYCCSGHKDTQIFSYPDAPEEKTIYEEDGIRYGVGAGTSYRTYIKFDGAYNFETIPDGFTYETKDEEYHNTLAVFNSEHYEVKGCTIDDITFGDTISHDIDGRGKTTKEIDAEIKHANAILLEWAKELEPYKKKSK